MEEVKYPKQSQIEKKQLSNQLETNVITHILLKAFFQTYQR